MKLDHEQFEELQNIKKNLRGYRYYNLKEKAFLTWIFSTVKDTDNRGIDIKFISDLQKLPYKTAILNFGYSDKESEKEIFMLLCTNYNIVNDLYDVELIKFFTLDD